MLVNLKGPVQRQCSANANMPCFPVIDNFGLSVIKMATPQQEVSVKLFLLSSSNTFVGELCAARLHIPMNTSQYVILLLFLCNTKIK